MKAILEFNLPEDQIEHTNALKGTAYKIALDEMDNYFRSILKYEERPEAVRKELELARKELTRLTMEAEEL